MSGTRPVRHHEHPTPARNDIAARLSPPRITDGAIRIPPPTFHADPDRLQTLGFDRLIPIGDGEVLSRLPADTASREARCRAMVGVGNLRLSIDVKPTHRCDTLLARPSPLR